MKNQINLKTRIFNKDIKVDDYLIVGSTGQKVEVFSNLQPMEMLTILMPLLHELEMAIDKAKF